ncbi:hypothetical protein [Paenibacillus amylolyticus]|uniref:hypothetical protein n=1 Tax=Paenibacillus amylolyticus TaxID=1451 RepID=UPI003D96FC83
MSPITMRQAVQADQEQLADLRALVLYDDLTRLGRYDDVKVRERFRNTFDPAQTQIIELEGSMVGCVALKPKSEALTCCSSFLMLSLSESTAIIK